MCAALNSLAECRDIEVVWPVHPNPQVLPILKDKLRRTANMHVIAPVDYLSFIALMMRAYIIITDLRGHSRGGADACQAGSRHARSNRAARSCCCWSRQASRRIGRQDFGRCTRTPRSSS